MTHLLCQILKFFLWHIVHKNSYFALYLFQNLCIKSEHAPWINVGHSLKIWLKQWVHHWRKCSLVPGCSLAGYKSQDSLQNSSFGVQNSAVQENAWFQNSFYLLASFQILVTFSPPCPILTPLSIQSPVLLVWCDSQQIVRSMSYTVDPEAWQHQAILAVHYAGICKADENWRTPSFQVCRLHQRHEVSGGQSHVLQLSGCEPKDIAKMIMTRIWDLKCKYLHPTESTEASDSDEGHAWWGWCIPSKGDILAEFPKEMLMTEVRTNISNSFGTHGDITHGSCWSNEKYEKAGHSDSCWCIPVICCRPPYSLI